MRWRKGCRGCKPQYEMIRGGMQQTKAPDVGKQGTTGWQGFGSKQAIAIARLLYHVSVVHQFVGLLVVESKCEINVMLIYFLFDERSPVANTVKQ